MKKETLKEWTQYLILAALIILNIIIRKYI
jgi:hypothetical protein